jgi:hypothetical protein
VQPKRETQRATITFDLRSRPWREASWRETEACDRWADQEMDTGSIFLAVRWRVCLWHCRQLRPTAQWLKPRHVVCGTLHFRRQPVGQQVGIVWADTQITNVASRLRVSRA